MQTVFPKWLLNLIYQGKVSNWGLEPVFEKFTRSYVTDYIVEMICGQALSFHPKATKTFPYWEAIFPNECLPPDIYQNISVVRRWVGIPSSNGGTINQMINEAKRVFERDQMVYVYFHGQTGQHLWLPSENLLVGIQARLAHKSTESVVYSMLQQQNIESSMWRSFPVNKINGPRDN